MFEQNKEYRYVFNDYLFNNILKTLKIYNNTFESILGLFNSNTYQIAVYLDGEYDVKFGKYKPTGSVLNVLIKIPPTMKHIGKVGESKMCVTNITNNIIDNYSRTSNVTISMVNDTIVFSINLDNRNINDQFKYYDFNGDNKGYVFNEFNRNERGKFEYDIDFVNEVYSRYPWSDYNQKNDNTDDFKTHQSLRDFLNVGFGSEACFDLKDTHPFFKKYFSHDI